MWVVGVARVLSRGGGGGGCGGGSGGGSMASFGAAAALRSRWGDLVEQAAPDVTPPDLSSSLRSVVGWLKQASLEVRAAGSRAVSSLRPAGGAGAGGGDAAGGEGRGEGDMEQDTFHIIHYNDVYNVDQSSTSEPVGGALRFVSAVRARAHLQPLVLFSGDAFSPSMLSTFTKGEQMVPVLNAAGTHCAVFGNHDFDFGLEVLSGLVKQCKFPWLMSNVVDRETGRPLGDGRITHAVLAAGRRIGLIGLVEQEWLDTLATINPEEVTFIDFVQAGDQLAHQLKQEGCDMVIALTHMRTRNDVKLAENTQHIDLILGGHDHDYHVQEVNNKLIVKSGTDFRQFSELTVTLRGGGGCGGEGEGAVTSRPRVTVARRDVTADLPEDPDLKPVLDQYNALVEGRMGTVLGRFSVPLEARFSEIRTKETNLGNWLSDVCLAATHADLVILNSGTFRSDRVHPAGDFTLRDLSAVVPMRDPLVLLAASGDVILQALENAVSKYPSLEGRFPQVGGVSFAFDPAASPGRRVARRLVKVGDEYLRPERCYRLCVKEYMHHGSDGFTMLRDCPVLVEADMCPEIGLCVQNHFAAVAARALRRPSRHRQSLVTLSRRHSLVKALEWRADEPPPPAAAPSPAGGGSPALRRAASLADTTPLTKHPKLSRRASLDDLEQQTCELAPRLEGRILTIDCPQTLAALEAERARHEADSVIREDDETGH